MDTKSKRFRRAPLVKALAFVLACLCLCVTVYFGLSAVYRANGLDNLSGNLEALMEAEYTASTAFARQVSQTTWRIYEALLEGAAVSPLLEEQVWYYASYDPALVADRTADDGPDTDKGAETTTMVALSPAEIEELLVQVADETFVTVAGPDTEEPATTVVLSNVGWTSSNSFRQASDCTYIYEQGVLVSAYEGTRYLTYIDEDSGVTLYLAFRPDYLAAQQTRWDSTRRTLMPSLWVMVGCLLAALAAVVYLSFVTGRRPGSDELFMSPLDSIYSDLLLCLIAGFAMAWVGLGAVLTESVTYGSSSYAPSVWFAVILTALCSPVILALWLSMMRKIKARRFMRHSLVWAVCSGIWRLVRGVFRTIGRFFDGLFGGRRFLGYPFAHALFRRQTTFILLSFLLVVGFVIFTFVAYDGFLMALACVAAEVVLIYYYVKTNNKTFQDMEKITTQVFEIYQGNMEYDPGVDPEGPLADTSHQLLDVGGGMEKAMARQLQSERMKIALVTNVSHDLKTPLTSIIGYIDLLGKDETLSPEARDYVTILASKSQRLKTIIEDLFDLAKTTSGDDTSLHMEVLDLRRLIEQTLADMDDKIERSGQPVRVTLPELAVFARADGRKLYRVIQNIMDNALKYSMPGTRIFVTLASDGRQARMTFKNTASYEMDFTAEEILERFVRGDKSRTTEGSGLGLSIAEGFTKALGGELRVSIDGDQFRVELIFDVTIPEPEEEEAAEEVPELVPPGMKARMEMLRGKLYKPQGDTPPKVVRHPEAEEDHFEPERPVELEELESVLSAFDTDRWSAAGLAGESADAGAEEESPPPAEDSRAAED